MSTPSPTGRPDAANASAKAFRWASNLARIALIGLVLYLGWGAYLGFRDMLSDPAPQVSEEIDLDEAAILVPAELLLNQPELGPWLMAGLPFQMESAEVEEKLLESVLAAPIPREDKREVWPLDEGLKGLFGLMVSRPRADGQGNVYRMDSPDQRIAVQSRRKDGKEYLVGGRLAQRGPGALWTVVEVTAGEGALDAVLHRGLLPLPLGARVLAQRRTETGRPLAEMVLLPGTMAAAREFWIERGWKTRPIKGWDEGKLLVCFKDGVSISAWAMPGEKAKDPTAVLLVRLPEPKDGSVSKRE